MKVHADFKAFAGVNFDASRYIASPSYGVNRFMLDRVGAEKARATTIVEYQPNSKFPEHQHIGGEEFLVLEGTFKDQFGAFGAGTYVRNPVGSKHAPWVDEDGCVIMVKLLQMADMGDQEVDPLHVPYDSDEVKAKAKSTVYGSVLDMYSNNFTGEQVSMCWIKPGAIFPTVEAGLGGEELFVVKGSVETDGVDYTKWGWLRFPVGLASEDRKTLKAGSDGAQVYRKCGHLTQKALDMEKIKIDFETEKVI